MKPLYLTLLLIFLSLNCLSQSKLDQSKKDLNKSAEKRGETVKKYPDSLAPETNGSSSSSSYSSSDPDSFESLIGGAIITGVMYLTVYSVIGNYESEFQLQNNLTTNPYNFEKTGNYIDNETVNKGLMRLDVDNQLLLSSHSVLGNHLKAKLRPLKYFYLQTDYYQLVEVDNLSSLALFNFNFCYDRLRFERFNLGWTMGANYIPNDVKKAGFTFGFNTEWFITKPFSLFSAFKWCRINQQPVNQIELQGKYHFNKYFLSVGYEYMKIGSPQYNFVSVGGGVYL